MVLADLGPDCAATGWCHLRFQRIASSHFSMFARPGGGMKDMPISMNGERIRGANGLEIFIRSWRPEGAPRAVVAICHGVNSHGDTTAGLPHSSSRAGSLYMRSISMAADNQ